jgi:hypothetical protein
MLEFGNHVKIGGLSMEMKIGRQSRSEWVVLQFQEMTISRLKFVAPFRNVLATSGSLDGQSAIFFNATSSVNDLLSILSFHLEFGDRSMVQKGWQIDRG